MKRRFLDLSLVWALLAAAVALPARADGPLHSYALVIGSNRGGAGQATLSYAEQDAQRMAQVLAELGRTPRENIRLLAHPSAPEVERALAQLRAKLTGHAERGERTQVLFYYSGHARAHALTLGDEELSLQTLRTALTSLPSTLTVVVLDACQSGAFSGVKGAAPAADFSISSVNDLHSEGIAVMASSTGAELSQESRELESSYFSHHLVVALRGAGDADTDGRVSLDEAYRYAYAHTLSDTARTQVGSQHATLETELRGRGDVPLSYPVDADAVLALPAQVEGRVLVQQARRGAIMAELIKSKGAPLMLALPSGSYEVVVRSERGDARACQVQLIRGATHTLAPETCPRQVLSDGGAKGKDDRGERWFVEVGFAVNDDGPEDGYVQTLKDFRFESDIDFLEHLEDNVALAAGLGLHRYVSVLARFDTLEHRLYQRNLQGPDGLTRDDRFEWVTRAVSLGARGRLPLAREWVVLFAELDVGLGITRSEMSGTDPVKMRDFNAVEHHFGVALRGTAGATFGVTRHFGLYLAAGYSFAPVLENRIGDTHDDGGFTFSTGLRLRSLKGWW